MDTPPSQADSCPRHRTHRAQNARLPQGWLKTARTTILRRIFILTALTSCHFLSLEGCLAHPISVTYTQAFVSRDEVIISIEGFLEDLYLFHDLKTNNKGLVRPEEIKRGLALHEKFLAEKFQVRDASGTLLKPQEVRLKDISPLGEGVHLMDLMAHETEFELRYELPSPPDYLTFTQKFTGELDLLPAEMLLQVQQEKASAPHSVSLMPNRSETVRFDWEQPALSPEASQAESERWFQEKMQETLGITSYSSVYSFLYIEDHEVRHEILIPLATLNESVTLERDKDEFLDLSEQDAARDAIATHFLEGNPIEIDGVEIAGNVTRLNFYGVDFTDFAREAPKKRVPMSSARVGIILSYPSTTPPQSVKLTWNRFSEFLQRVNLAVIADDETLSATLGRIESTRSFEWTNPGRARPEPIKAVTANLPPRPTLSIPLVSLLCLLLGAVVFVALKRRKTNVKSGWAALAGLILIAAISWPWPRWKIPDPFTPPAEIASEELDRVVATLIQNIYGSFRFRDESTLYDSLASSIHGELLSKVYLEIKRGLIIEEQGGAVSRVDQVEMINGQRLALWEPSPGETLPDNSLSYRCEWNVTATVEHWGHLHERTNQYSAVFAIVPVEGHWKIIEFELLNETRLQSETRLRRLATLSE